MESEGGIQTKRKAESQAVCNAQPEMSTLHVRTSKPVKASRNKLWLEDVISMIEHSAAAYGLPTESWMFTDPVASLAFQSAVQFGFEGSERIHVDV